jgi:hypothetical protein
MILYVTAHMAIFWHDTSFQVDTTTGGYWLLVDGRSAHLFHRQHTCDSTATTPFYSTATTPVHSTGSSFAFDSPARCNTTHLSVVSLGGRCGRVRLETKKCPCPHPSAHTASGKLPSVLDSCWVFWDFILARLLSLAAERVWYRTEFRRKKVVQSSKNGNRLQLTLPLVRSPS